MHFKLMNQHSPGEAVWIAKSKPTIEFGNPTEQFLKQTLPTV